MNLHPPGVIDDCLERHIAMHTVRAAPLYLTIVALVVVAATALPFIQVDVSVQSDGIIRPSSEKSDVRARVSGVAAVVLVHGGQRVARGDVVARLRAASVEERDALIASQTAVKERALGDLQLLATADGDASIPADRIASPDLRQEYAQFTTELGRARADIAKAELDQRRTQALFDRGFTTPAALQDAMFTTARARSDMAAVVERYRARWQAQRAVIRADLEGLRSQRALMAEEKALYAVTAPVAGTIEELSGIAPGSFVQAGDRMATISPDTDLVADIVVSPRDIGLIRPGADVRLLVDAFNYTEWGYITGHVRDVSDDYFSRDGVPAFHVRCSMDQKQLTLRNGFVGHLAKGMTLRARFLVSRRSLLQLLYDDINDWLNPVLNGGEVRRV